MSQAGFVPTDIDIVLLNDRRFFSADFVRVFLRSSIGKPPLRIFATRSTNWIAGA